MLDSRHVRALSCRIASPHMRGLPSSARQFFERLSRQIPPLASGGVLGQQLISSSISVFDFLGAPMGRRPATVSMTWTNGGRMWALESGVLKNFFPPPAVLRGTRYHTSQPRCKSRNPGDGVKHKQMATTLFEWHLCTTVTVSPLIVVEMIHSWGGGKISGHSLVSPALFSSPALKRTNFTTIPCEKNFQENFHPYYPPRQDQY